MGKAYTEEEKIEIKKRIWEAAIELFHSSDAKKLNVRTLTSMAGISLGSFYNFYPDQESLMADIIKYRVKKPASIYEKLLRRGYPVSLESVEKNLHDVAGIRVICSYVQDIYMVADLLTAQNDITLLEVKDYIKNPKPNGYRSLHLVVQIPVFFSEECRNMKVEVQIRTIAMDFWATLEHQLKYKNDGDVPEGLVEELRACSDVIADSDMRMQNLYNQVYKQG